MGDFEDIFGPSGDVEYWDGAGPSTVDVLERGSELDQAKTFFDITGQVWHPSHVLHQRLSIAELIEIDALAKEAHAAFKADWRYSINISEAFADAFLGHVAPCLERLRPSLDVFESFIAKVVRQCSYPAVFARDTGPQAGYVSRSLSSHIIALPDAYCIVRLGDLSLDIVRPRNHDMVSYENSHCWFAAEEPHRKVLEISRALLCPEEGISDVPDWVRVCQAKGWSIPSDDTYDAVALYAAKTERRKWGGGRNWSAAAEAALRTRVVSLIGALLTPGSSATVYLRPDWSGSSLDCELELPREWSRAREKEIARDFNMRAVTKAALDLIDFSSFRANVGACKIRLLDNMEFPGHQQLDGRTLLFDLLDETGRDSRAAADALERQDYECLHRIITRYDPVPRDYDDIISCDDTIPF